jgi:hypothetical protein
MLHGVLDFHGEAGNTPWCLSVSRSNSRAGLWHHMITDLEASPWYPILDRIPCMEWLTIMFMALGVQPGMGYYLENTRRS